MFDNIMTTLDYDTVIRYYVIDTWCVTSDNDMMILYGGQVFYLVT